jgi:hypothetical protein
MKPVHDNDSSNSHEECLRFPQALSVFTRSCPAAQQLYLLQQHCYA